MREISKLVEDVLKEVSGKKAWNWVAKITQYNRLKGTQEYHEIVEHIINELNNFNLDEVKLLKYPANGKTKSWAFTTSRCWDVKSGELWLIEPNKELLCRFDEIPMCIVTNSKSCNIITELVDVGEGISEENFKGKDVKGKFVLMSAPKLAISPLYVDKGAVGVIIYPDSKRANGYRDMTIYKAFQSKNEILEKTTFGFSITYEQAMYLKELLKEGIVKIHGKIDAHLFDGDIEVISAAINGTEISHEEIILTAHLCHPKEGANDNASGSAGLIELVRSLITLIKNKIINPPKRTIRFLWVPEFEGTWPWAKENETKVKNALCNLNLDMIGEHPIKIGKPCDICQAPYSRPSILNDLIRYFTQEIADHPNGTAVNGTNVPMRYRITPFTGGSDQHVFVDTVIGIPGMMFGHTDPLWHTSLDTIENVDSTEMQRVISIALCTSYIFATLDAESLIEIWPILEEGFYQRLGKVKKVLLTLYKEILDNSNSIRSIEIKVSKEEKAFLGLALLEAIIHFEKEILNSIKRFNPSVLLEKGLISIRFNELNQWFEYQKSQWITICKDAGVDLNIIDEPLFLNNKWELLVLGIRSFIDFFSLYFSKPFEKIKSPEPPELYLGDIHEIFNLIGCSFNLKMICAMLTIEYNHIFLPTEVQEYLKFLEEKKYIKRI
ncbi:MAG: DUF4910 domain-containing protein [Candidatus Hodarchaeota archaeon]